jgi:Trp operon repressor
VSKINQEPETVDEDNPFVEVLKIIDDLIVELANEEKDDLATKEQCEKERMEKTQQAKMVSKEIDTSVETIDRLTSQIEAANRTVQEIMEEIAGMREELRDAGVQRDKEHTEYQSAKADDQTAVELVNNAIGALDKFYERNNLMLGQVRRHGQEPFVAAGEAPTPPPATWNEEYGGAKGATGGITSVLAMIAKDIENDIAKGDKQEEEAVTNYDKLVADIEAGIGAKEKTKSDLEGEMASDEGSRTEEEGTKATSKEELDSTLGYLKEIAAGCDFMAMNFDKRLKNRQLESDGLKKAKAILEGATFE